MLFYFFLLLWGLYDNDKHHQTRLLKCPEEASKSGEGSGSGGRKVAAWAWTCGLMGGDLACGVGDVRKEGREGLWGYGGVTIEGGQGRGGKGRYRKVVRREGREWESRTGGIQEKLERERD